MVTLGSKEALAAATSGGPHLSKAVPKKSVSTKSSLDVS